MNAQHISPFEQLWALGYHRLVPIIPPGAPVSERSSLFKRLARGDDARGKMPGIQWPDGTWSGFDFTKHESSPQDIQRWAAMGAGVGIKTGAGLALIDADTMDLHAAAAIRRAIDRRCGQLPARIGRAPKAGYLVRVTGDFQYARVEFGQRDAKGRLQDRVEILYEGRQFVAVGTHPVTGQPYRWEHGGPPPLASVPSIPAPELYALLEDLRLILPAAKDVIREGGGSEIDQTRLAGDPATVAAAVRALPNTSALFPSREDYVAFGYAIRAALPNDEPLARELYHDWCARWQDGDNDPDIVDAEWRRMKPPYRRGASWLYELATAHSGGQFDDGGQWLDDPTDGPLFPPDPADDFSEKSSASSIVAQGYRFIDARDIPPRQVLYGSHYVRKYVSTTAAPTKVGKTSLLIVEALAMASGRPLLGVKVERPLRVWLWNGEDPLEEMERRIAAAMLHYGLSRGDLCDADGTPRLYVNGRETEIVLAVSGRDGTRIAEPVEAAVIGEVERLGIDVFSVDPFVSSHRVPENDNGAVDLVAKRWARLAGRCGCAVELVHHVRKLNGAEVSIEDTRGASALISAARSARALARMTKEEGRRMGLPDGVARRLFRFADAQSNLALPAGEEEAWMELKGVPLGNGGAGADGSGRAAAHASGAGGVTGGAGEWARGDNVGVVALWEGETTSGGAGMTAEERRAVELIREYDGEWRADVRAGDAWIGVPFAIAHGWYLDDPEDKGKARAMVRDWLKRGRLKEVTGRDNTRRTRQFIVLNDLHGTSVSGDMIDVQSDSTSGGLFE